MEIKLIEAETGPEFEPLCCRRSLGEVPVGNIPLAERIREKLCAVAPQNGMTVSVKTSLWPSDALIAEIVQANRELVVAGPDSEPVLWISKTGEIPHDCDTIQLDEESAIIRYSWDLLAINEEIAGKMTENNIEGEIRDNVVIDGNVTVGLGTVLLPGVYIEGNVIIGANCKIGPNCYIRGKTSIGDNCHIGQAVEIKNSILMNNIGAGHLSYIGDSIVCPQTNFGAGTITANFRHDGKNHRSTVNGELIDTGRRKFGAIIGDNVHTGIHTSIYPGRKIWPDMSTRPGEIVNKDVN